MKTYTFHVSIPGTGRVWRKVEVRADQTLEDLHLAIQEAYDFDNDHLYSFFMSGKAWDRDTEYCLPEGTSPWGEEFDSGYAGDDAASALEVLGIPPDYELPPDFELTPQKALDAMASLVKKGPDALTQDEKLALTALLAGQEESDLELPPFNLPPDLAIPPLQDIPPEKMLAAMQTLIDKGPDGLTLEETQILAALDRRRVEEYEEEEEDTLPDSLPLPFDLPPDFDIPPDFELTPDHVLDAMTTLISKGPGALTPEQKQTLTAMSAGMFGGYGGDEPGDVRITTLESLNLKPKQEFMYLFDYGDEWRFKVQVHAVNPDAPAGSYPRVVETVGEAPPQYAYADDDYDDEWDDELDFLQGLTREERLEYVLEDAFTRPEQLAAWLDYLLMNLVMPFEATWQGARVSVVDVLPSTDQGLVLMTASGKKKRPAPAHEVTPTEADSGNALLLGDYRQWYRQQQDKG